MDFRKIGESLLTNGIIAVLGTFAGYMLGTEETSAIRSDLLIIKTGMADLKAQEKSHDAFVVCAMRHIDSLERRGEPPPCDLGAM